MINFHGNRRCFSCQTIEEFTKETLEEFFQPELQDGKITFESINVEEIQNNEIVQKYQARGSSLFINGGVVIFEIILDVITKSMALISDATHNVSDISAMILGFWSEKIAKKPANKKKPMATKKLNL